MTRVLLADDHKIVRQGTKRYLESMGIEVIGEVTNGHEAVSLALQQGLIAMVEEG